MEKQTPEQKWEEAKKILHIENNVNFADIDNFVKEAFTKAKSEAEKWELLARSIMVIRNKFLLIPTIPSPPQPPKDIIKNF